MTRIPEFLPRLLCVAVCVVLFRCDTDDTDQTALVTGAALALQATTLAASGSSNGGSDSGDGSTTDTTCAGTGACMMFRTSGNATTNAGISGLDANCASDAAKPSGGGTYKAMVADGTNRIACTTANCGGGTGEHTDWVLKPNKEYRRSDGTTVIGTTTANGVFSFPLTAEVETVTVGTNSTWTGLNTNWTSSTNDCSNWGSTATTGTTGLHDQTNTNLLSIGTSGCANNAKVICVEQ